MTNKLPSIRIRIVVLGSKKTAVGLLTFGNEVDIGNFLIMQLWETNKPSKQAK